MKCMLSGEAPLSQRDVFEIHAVVCVRRFFFFFFCGPVCIYHSLFIHSSTDGHLGCSQFGATMNKPAGDILEILRSFSKVVISFTLSPTPQEMFQ